MVFKSFKSKTVVVTGASKGIGRCLVMHLLESGANVAGMARSGELLDAISEEAKKKGWSFLGCVCDVTDGAAVSRSNSVITERFGDIDVLINNAGMGLMGPGFQATHDEVRRVFDVNFFGAVNCVLNILPEMIKRRNGLIVNIASLVAGYGLPTVSYYSAAKAALAVYSQSLRAELKPAGIKVMTVFPGNTDTDFHKDILLSGDYIRSSGGDGSLSADVVAVKILQGAEDGKCVLETGKEAMFFRIIRLMAFFIPAVVDFVLAKKFGVGKWYRRRPELNVSHSGVDACIISGLKLGGLDEPCLYHAGAEFLNWWSIVPEGASPVLMYLLYPYLFAASYGGNIPSGEKYRFKDETGRDITVSWGKDPAPLVERIKNPLKTLLIPFKPMGRISCEPYISVDGKRYVFNLGGHGTLCPAAFRSVFPYMALLHGRYGRTEASKCLKIVCPDHLKNLVFGEGEPGAEFYRSICFWGEKARIKILSPCSSGRCAEADSLDAIIKKLSFPCPALLNVAHGYYLALAKGGELGFYSRSLFGAVFQCPHPQSKVAVEIRKSSGTMTFEVVATGPVSCARGIKIGDKFEMPVDIERCGFCMDAFNSLFLHCGLAGIDGKIRTVNCVKEGCSAEWEVSVSDESGK